MDKKRMLLKGPEERRRVLPSSALLDKIKTVMNMKGTMKQGDAATSCERENASPEESSCASDVRVDDQERPEEASVVDKTSSVPDETLPTIASSIICLRFPISLTALREHLTGPRLDAALLASVKSASEDLAQLPRNWHEASSQAKVEALASALVRGLYGHVDAMQPESELFREQIRAVEDMDLVLKALLDMYAQRKKELKNPGQVVSTGAAVKVHKTQMNGRRSRNKGNLQTKQNPPISAGVSTSVIVQNGMTNVAARAVASQSSTLGKNATKHHKDKVVAAQAYQHAGLTGGGMTSKGSSRKGGGKRNKMKQTASSTPTHLQHAPVQLSSASSF
ncbi:unnamed protein product, partial [Amoebophrya sp. A25]|eukprot:GSA25T00015507001.1